MTWALHPVPNGGETTPLFALAGWTDAYPPDQLAHTSNTWGQIVARLADHAETGQPQPIFAPAAASHA